MADDLILRIGAKTKDFDEALKSIQDKTKNLEAKLKSVAVGSGVAFAALTTSAFGASKAFETFDNELRSVKTLLDESSFGAKGLDQGFKDMRAEALKLATQVPVNISSMNKALFDTVSAGIDAAGSVQAVGVSAKLAVAGVTDVSIATDGMTSALNAYQFSAEQADAVAAKFFITQKFGKTTIAELSQGFGLVGSSASALGVSFEELLASISAATLAGVKTNAAYTGMKAVLAGISKPTQEAKDEARRLGIEFNAAALKAKGFDQFLSDLTGAAGFTQNSLIKLFGSTEAQNIMFALTGAQASKFSSTLAALKDEQEALNVFTKAYDEQVASGQNGREIILNQMTAYAILIGEKLAPAMNVLYSVASKLLTILATNEYLVTFSAGFIAIGAAVSGTILALTAGALGFLKVRTSVLAAAKVFPLLDSSLTLLSAGFARARVAAIAMFTTLKGAVAATGIGLLILLVTDLALNWETRWKQMSIVYQTFADKVSSISSGIGTLLQGVFTLDSAKISAGFEEAKNALSQSFDEIAQKFTELETQKTEALAAGEDARGSIKDSAAAKDVEREAETNSRILELKDELTRLKQEADVTNRENQRERELEFQVELQRIETEGAIERANVDNDILLERRRREDRDKTQRLIDEKKYGKAVSEIKAFFRKEEVEGVKAASGELTALSQSRNATLFAVGKAASIARAVISTQEGAIAAYTSLAPIPFVGPALGAAAAAALIAYGFERVSNIKNQSMPGYARGGPVVGGIAGVDSVPILAQMGEIVTPPESYDEHVNAVADKRNLERQAAFGQPQQSRDESTINIILELKDQLVDFIEAKLVERRVLGTSLGVI